MAERKDPRHIMFRVERATLSSGEVVGALVPRFMTDRRMMRERGYRVGDDLRAALSKPRILGQHRKAHLLGALVVAQVDGFEGMDSHAALKRLQRESGICCEAQEIDASPVIAAILAAAESLLGAAAARMLGAVLPEIRTITVSVPQSLAFDRMDESEFQSLYSGLCRHVADKYWQGLSPEKIDEMAELMEHYGAV